MRMMPGRARIDGGRGALAGYLFQMLSVLGMRASADPGRSQAVSTTTRHEELLALVAQGTITSEEYDTDAVVRSLRTLAPGQLALVQFKYSSNPSRYAIGPEELSEIVKALDTSRTRVELSGERVTHYYLITNRHLNGPAAAMKTAADNNRTDNPDLGTFGITTPTGRRGKPYQVMRQLIVCPDIDFGNYVRHLKKFAQERGCLSDEIEHGNDQLVGKLVRRAADGDTTPITIGDLLEAFTNSCHATPLTLRDIAPLGDLNIREFSEETLDIGTSGPLRRRIVDTILEASRERHLIILHGPGGAGKTAALVSCFQELNATGGAGVNITHAEQLNGSSLLSKVICQWRSVTDNEQLLAETHDKAILRLQIANPNALPPLVHLGLDGYDELPDGSHSAAGPHVRELITFFWQRERHSAPASVPQVTLVVTCREFEKVCSLLRIDRGFGRSSEPFGVPIGMFSWRELIDVTRQYPDDGLADLIENASSFLEQGHAEDSGSVSSSRPKVIGPSTRKIQVSNVDVDVLNAIRQPSMWRALMTLTPPDRLAALHVDAASRGPLATAFLHWFCIKAGRRDVRLSEEKRIRRALLRIAERYPERTPHLRSEWVQAAEASNAIGGLLASDLYDEALSAGVIDADSEDIWRWSHPFISEYLINSGSAPSRGT
jgi:hypothetical protein